MQSFGILVIFAGLTLAASGVAGDAAGATPPARALAFRCEGDQCSGAAPAGPSDGALLRECEQVVSVIGPVSRYQSRGRELSARDLAHCNRRATRTPVAE